MQRTSKACLLLALTCLAGPTWATITVKDDTNQAVTLTHPARRIVSLAPTSTESLFAVGAGPAVVGVSDICDYPAAAKMLPKIGSYSAPDMERIIAAKPELIVAVYGNPVDLVDRLRRRGLPVYVCNPTTVGGVLRNLTDLGHLTGRDVSARRLVSELQARLKRVARRVARQPAVNTLVVIWDEPLTVAGGKSFIEDILRHAGGRNAATAVREAYPKLDPERLLVLNPEVVLFPISNDVERVQRLREKPGFRQTSAIRGARLYAPNPDWLMRPGPRVVMGVEAVARLLHPTSTTNK